MNRDQITALLELASAFDGRVVDDAAIDAWSIAAGRAGWTYEAAIEALLEHYANSAAWVMPGHITRRIRLEHERAATGPHQCSDDGACCRILDPATRVALDVDGAPGVEAAETVDGHGRRELWIVETPAIGLPVDHGDPQPSHETLGRLPVEIRDRIWGPALRCGRPTTSGRPCRARVAEPGGVCAAHRAVTA